MSDKKHLVKDDKHVSVQAAKKKKRPRGRGLNKKEKKSTI